MDRWIDIDDGLQRVKAAKASGQQAESCKGLWGPTAGGGEGKSPLINAKM